MTDTTTKIRSLFLATLMVLSVFAGTIALSGAAVGQAGNEDANFEQSVVQDETGDLAEFNVTLENADSAQVTIGGDNVNYEVDFTVTDKNDDGKVTVQFNTYAPNSDSSFTAAGEDTVSNISFVTKRASSGPLDAADYDLAVSIEGDEKDVGTLALSEGNISALNIWTAPKNNFGDVSTSGDVVAAIEDGTITQDNTIAEQDVIVFQLQASSIQGAFESQDGTTPEAKFQNLIATEEFDLTVAQTNPGANTNPKYLDTDNTSTSAYNVVPDSANNTLYVSIKSDQAQFERVSTEDYEAAEENDTEVDAAEAFTSGSSAVAEAGDDFAANFTVESSSVLVSGEEDLSVGSEFSIVERAASFDADSQTSENGDLVTVESAGNQTVSGTTSVAPGTEFTVRARATGDSPFLKTADGAVNRDGTFNVSFDFATVSAGQNFTLSIRNQQFADGNNAETSARVAQAPDANVSISNQSSAGDEVVVDSVNMSEGGFVTIHDSSLLDGQTFASVRGSSEYLEAGQHSNVTVTLDKPYTQAGTAIAMPHQDTNNNQQYDFVTSNGSEDGPYTTAGGDIVLDSANLTVEGSAGTPGTDTGTGNGTPGTETETETPTPTETEQTPQGGTETPTGQPGFGLAVSIVALAGAALLALRRD